MKNILFFNNIFFPLSETFVYNQIKGLSEYYNISLLGYQYANEDVFPLKKEKHLFCQYTNTFERFYINIKRRITGNSFLISRKALKKNIDTVKQMKVDVIYAHFGNSGVKIYPVARQLGIPLVVIFHGVDASPKMLKDKIYRTYVQDVIKYASQIVLVSKHMIETLELENVLDKVTIIPCGIDANKFVADQCPVVKDENDCITFLHVGRIVPKKGVTDLIKVFNDLSGKYNVKLEIIGTGPEMDICKQLANDKVIFYGAQEHEFIIDKLRKADVYILNSRTSADGDMEGSPTSIIEALSIGKPVISTMHAGIPDAITSEENGLLVDEYDNQNLYLAMERLVLDKELRQKIAGNARASILDNYTIDCNIENLKKVFDSILK